MAKTKGIPIVLIYLRKEGYDINQSGLHQWEANKGSIHVEITDDGD